MFEAVEALLTEHAELERRLADPAIHADQATARRVGRRYAELQRVVAAYAAWRKTGDDLEAARELAPEDPDFAAEAERLATEHQAQGERLRLLLVPRDPLADKNVLLEVKGKGGAAAEPDQTPYSRLKFEGGVHRVQRVPVTESQGRIHTSAAGVLVLPEAEDVDVELDEKDLRVDVFRSSGPGGQSVNTTDSAVRITHVPSGIVVSCQNEKSQLQNKEQALRILRSRLLAIAQERADADAAAARRSQVRTVDRSERVRTYNFPQNRLTDHRVGFTAYNLDQVLDGDLDAVTQSLLDADQAERLASLENAAGASDRRAEPAGGRT